MRPVVLLTALVAILIGGCARPGPVPGGGPSAGAEPGPAAAVYSAVLVRYLSTGDHSFGADHRFPATYILDRADTAAADPMAGSTTGAPATRTAIAPADQAAIIAALGRAGLTSVAFVADRATVVEAVDGCAQVRGGGVLITLGPVVGAGDRVEVGISGFVACLAATWFTYVIERQGGEWRVSGTTGPMAIA